jgi:hypothetical protein
VLQLSYSENRGKEESSPFEKGGLRGILNGFLSHARDWTASDQHENTKYTSGPLFLALECRWVLNFRRGNNWFFKNSQR